VIKGKASKYQRGTRMVMRFKYLDRREIWELNTRRDGGLLIHSMKNTSVRKERGCSSLKGNQLGGKLMRREISKLRKKSEIAREK